MIGTGNCRYGNGELMYAIKRCCLLLHPVRCLENVNHLKLLFFIIITFSMSELVVCRILGMPLFLIYIFMSHTEYQFISNEKVFFFIFVQNLR